MNLFHKSFIYSLLFLGIIACKKQETVNTKNVDTDITILAVNDMHSAVERFDRLAFVVDSIRKNQPNVLLLSSGDNRTGNPINDIFLNMPMISLMNLIGFDASAIGNHEFDGGQIALSKNIRAAKFPFLCANMHPDKNLNIPILPYKTFSINGATINVVSVVHLNDNETPDCYVGYTQKIKFSKVEDAINQHFDSLRANSNLLILLTHVGIKDDRILAKEYPSVDVIVGGHSHDKIKNENNGTVLITQAEKNLNYLSVINVSIRKGKVVSKKHHLIDLRQGSNVDSSIKKEIEKLTQKANLGKIIASVTDTLNQRQLGDLEADAIKNATNSDIAIINIGGVRINQFCKSEISVNDVFCIDPFFNQIFTFQLTGSEVQKILESISEKDKYGAPCVAGIKYSITIKPSKNRFKTVDIHCYNTNNSEFDKNKIYKVALCSYCASLIKFIDHTNGVNQKISTSNALLKYISKTKCISQIAEHETVTVLEP